MKKFLLSLLACFVGGCVTASAEQPPIMGWSSWNTYGFQINDSLVRTQADAMVNLGFFEKGYKYINIDDGFFGGRDKDGHLLIHPTRFPNGLRPLVDYIQENGNRFLGMQVYAQQVLSAITLLITLILLVYINTVMRKKH